MEVCRKNPRQIKTKLTKIWVRDYLAKQYPLFNYLKMKKDRKQVRIHESTVACDWAGAVMPENHEKMKSWTFWTFLNI